ncbi:MAG: hypothetical protein F4180_06865 [Chloroflexi bacterium]|nr:hypothetical protein [Chloroflexota bacterium]
MSDSSYEDRHPKVNSLIQELGGKEDLERLEKDMEIVYRWGGGLGSRLFNQIINSRSNSPDRVREQVKAAFFALGEDDPVQALEELKSLRWCGDSFGTKVLAMRSPESAPIWDEIAKACLSEFRIDGKRIRSYGQFITFCKHIRSELQRKGKEPPRGESWYLRDIEMAIFQFGWDNGKFKWAHHRRTSLNHACGWPMPLHGSLRWPPTQGSEDT